MPRRPGPPSAVQLDPTPPPRLVLAREHPKAHLAALERTGAVMRLRRGAYLPATTLDTIPEHAAHRLEQLGRTAAVARQLERATLSHTSAALWWGLPVVTSSQAVHVVQPHRASSRSAKDIRRHSLELAPEHVTEHHGVRVTTLERTVVDCATLLRVEPALILADAALHAGADLAVCREILGSLGSRRGTARARAVLEHADGGAESPGETRTRLLVLRAGLPAPVTQVPVTLPATTYWADLGWPELRVLLEYDGVSKYTANGAAADAVLAEKYREEAIARAGFRVVRVTRSDLRAGGHLVARLRRLADFGPAVPRPELNA